MRLWWAFYHFFLQWAQRTCANFTTSLKARLCWGCHFSNICLSIHIWKFTFLNHWFCAKNKSQCCRPSVVGPIAIKVVKFGANSGTTMVAVSIFQASWLWLNKVLCNPQNIFTWLKMWLLKVPVSLRWFYWFPTAYVKAYPDLHHNIMGESFQDYSWIQDVEDDFPQKVILKMLN